jgi:spermidine synthase
MLFPLVIVLGSFLLFLIEPIAAKHLLPLLGGSAAVWTACLVFFQSVLLLGYFCAHVLATRLTVRQQSLAFLAILGAALVQLVVVPGRTWQGSTAHPIVSVFALLGGLIGFPFLALSTSSPLLQSWFGHGMASSTISPFYLFAVSNLGSLAALLAYPAVIEPYVSLRNQMSGWSAAFAVFVLLCGIVSWRGRDSFAKIRDVSGDPSDSAPGFGACALWFLLAGCGSLWLCAITNYLSRNVAAVPLLWTIPLAAYLLSFVAAFNGRILWPRWLALTFLAGAIGTTRYVLYEFTDVDLLFAAIPIFSGVLFVCCAFCHGEIYRLRPSPRHLTSLYLWVSAGGAAGAIFVGVVAPVLFSANYELFWALILVSALAAVVSWKREVLWSAAWTVATAAIAVWLVSQARIDRRSTIAQARSFYGTLRVTETPRSSSSTTRTLYNGTIEHGAQPYGSGEPLRPNTYYSEGSGIWMAMNLCCSGPRRVGIIGLGTGTLASFGRPGDVFRFYEIDPLVEHIARTMFTYLSESDASVEVVLGDARVSLASEPSQQFDVLAVDAFSGDAIPVHLLTAEAVALYRRHLKPDGILAMHVTNQYLDLAPVVQQQADHAGLHAALIIASPNPFRDANRSDWVLVSANRSFFELPQIVAAKEDRIAVPATIRLWDDDYNSLLPIVRWQRREAR